MNRSATILAAIRGPRRRTTEVPITNGEFAASIDELRRPVASKRLVFAIVAIAMFMISFDVAIVAVALPTIHRNLHAAINWAGWTITIYGLVLIVTLPIAGKLSDQFGRRKIFLCGIALFTVASFACGVASDIYMLIVFRALQAIGGGALAPVASGIVTDHFGSSRDRALGLFGSITAGGQITGPIFGALFVGYLSWRWIFFINVPIGVFLFVLSAVFVPRSARVTATRVDLKGLSLMAGLLLTAIFGITVLGNGHSKVTDVSFLAPELCAAVLLVLFVRHSSRVDAPFIPVRLLWGRGFGELNVLNLLLGVVSFGFASLVPLYASDRYGLSVLKSGSLLTGRGVGMISVGVLATFALRRTGYRLPILIGLGTIVAGTLLVSVAPRWGMSPYAWLSVGSVIAGLGSGVISPAGRNAGLQLAPDDVAVISALRQSFAFIGAIFSVAIVTAILNRSQNPGLAQAHVLWVVGVVTAVVMIPLALRIPEHKGSW